MWRWRRNPLCRATDLAEAWVTLAALLLTLLVAPVAGVLAGGAAQDAQQRFVREQRAARHPVMATVVREVERAAVDLDPETGAAQELRTRVLAGWTAPDGTERRAAVATSLRAPRAGDRFRIWTDGQGRMAAPPPDPATVATHAVLAGFGAALVAAGCVEAARRLAVWRMARRRYARLDRAWDRTGPDWGRTGTGS
nr:hypothetical protein [Streptomyces harenosi]